MWKFSSFYKAEALYRGSLILQLQVSSHLNLPLLYWFCQTSPIKNELPNLLRVTSILVYCIFEWDNFGIKLNYFYAFFFNLCTLKKYLCKYIQFMQFVDVLSNSANVSKYTAWNRKCTENDCSLRKNFTPLCRTNDLTWSGKD